MALEAVDEPRDPGAELEPAPASSRRQARSWAMALMGVVVLPIAFAVGVTALAPSVPDASSARVISEATLEADYGVRFDLVAVTASGGLVDLRFTILDEEKAKAKGLFHSVASSPALLVEGKGTVLRTRKGMNHTLSLLTGGRYFVLFSNSGGVIQAGTKVSVVIDDVRLESMAATS